MAQRVGLDSNSSSCSKRSLARPTHSSRGLSSMHPALVRSAAQPSTEDNDRPGAVRNIARHYDLSNDLFAIFLDQSMTYSAALFTDEHATLEQAQAHKIERIARRCWRPIRHSPARNRDGMG